MIELGALGFLNPWFLTGLLALPVLWLLLRITPPAPKVVAFPPLRLLLGLASREETPAAAPWWLVLMRLLLAALVILALARPLWNPGAGLPGTGPLLVVVEDGWSAAPGWVARVQALDRLLDRAERHGRNVILQTTAPPASGQAFATPDVITPSQARAHLSRLEPKPWPADHAAVGRALNGLDRSGSIPVYWASDGLGGEDRIALAEDLQHLGSLTILQPGSAGMPLLLNAEGRASADLTLTLSRPEPGAPMTLGLLARGEDNRAIGRAEARFDPTDRHAKAVFSLPGELRNRIARVEVENRPGAGEVFLFDDRWRRRPVGIVQEGTAEQGLALLSESYYLERALDPVGELSQAPVGDLLKAGQSVIVLPDAANLDIDDLGLLGDWVSEGGTLVRFAGPRLSATLDDTLVPVTLRRGGRAMDGSMQWSKPAELGAFPEDSPFRGIAVPDGVSIARQVLAEPGPGLKEATWARLKDDTPLVTARRQGGGWLILFHTTANADWAKIALSGVFVEMLQRIVDLSQGVDADGLEKAPLPPYRLMDGFGRLADPAGAARALPPQGEEAAEQRPLTGPELPPGYYGSDLHRRALNLAPQIGALAPLTGLPAGVSTTGYEADQTTPLMPWLLLGALALLLADGLATLKLRGLLRLPAAVGRGSTAALLAVLLLSPAAGPRDARAQQADTFALQSSLGTVLAYVETGDQRLDSVSRAGLSGLSMILNQRTAVEAGDPMGVDLERDEIAFFPLLYWPLGEAQQPLTQHAVDKVNRFLANGGMVLFDTGDRETGDLGDSGAAILRQVARNLRIPPLMQVPPGHVLTKSFYLMQEFPGRWAGGSLWVEAAAGPAKDGVSSVIIGGNSWAAAWALDAEGRPRFPVVPGGERQREMAYRFGVNLVMYTLTGNYKSDQVHVPAILERLGQ